MHLTGLEEKQKPCKHSYVVKQEVDLLLFQCAMQAGRLRSGNIFFVFMAPSSWYVYVSDNRVKLMCCSRSIRGCILKTSASTPRTTLFFSQKKRWDLNPRHSVLLTSALPPELLVNVRVYSPTNLLDSSVAIVTSSDLGPSPALVLAEMEQV